MKPVRFNIRVYGICLSEGYLLLSDEVRGGMPMCKLPGGGLEYGEGIIDCLHREWKEELDTEILIGDLFYVNPYLQISGFNPRDQVICLYYLVQLADPSVFPLTKQSYEIAQTGTDEQRFRWAPLDELGVEDMTFPIDRSMLEALQLAVKKNLGLYNNS